MKNGPPSGPKQAALRQATQDKLFLLGLGLVVIYFSIALLFMPRIADNVEQIVGVPEKYRSCGSRRACFDAIKINEILLACGVSAIEPEYRCGAFSFDVNRVAQAKYFSMPTVFSVIGLGGPANVLLEMRQDGELIYHKTVVDLQESYFSEPSITGIAIFIFSFFGIKKHRYFK